MCAMKAGLVTFVISHYAGLAAVTRMGTVPSLVSVCASWAGLEVTASSVCRTQAVTRSLAAVTSPGSVSAPRAGLAASVMKQQQQTMDRQLSCHPFQQQTSLQIQQSGQRLDVWARLLIAALL